jgi:hypothetical protein
MWRLLNIQVLILALDHDTPPPMALASETGMGGQLVTWCALAQTIVFARNGPHGWPHHNMPPFLTRSVSRILRTKPRTEQKSSCCRCMKSIHCLDLWNNLKNIFQGEWLDILVVNSWGLNDLHPRFPELASTSKYLRILLYNWWYRKHPTLR